MTPPVCPKAAHAFFASMAFMLAAACGGGSDPQPSTGSSTPPPPTGGGSTDPTWTSGVYAPSSQYVNRCETVRTGVDIEGDPFPDMAGSTLYENFFLRSWTHETYLWNDEVADRDPANYNDPVQYFAQLKTTAQTASGKDKDQFHFSQPTEDFLRERNAAPFASYGAVFFAFSVAPPRDVRVSYTEPGTPASEEIMGQPNLQRGSKILEIDGVDVVNTNTQSEIDALNAALFPENAGEMHTFVVEDPGSAGTRTVMLAAADISPSAVNLTDVIDTGTGKVGYAHITTFSPYDSEQQIADAIAALSADGVSDLVLDLRYNGGGLLAIASQLGFMVAGDAQTNGKTFERLQFNDDAGGVNPVTGETDNSTPFYSATVGFSSLAAGTPLTSLDLSRVFILTTENTCSASESVINALRGVDVEVVLIGEGTCGKPFGFYPESNCGQTYFSIQFQGVNDKDFGDYTDGFIAANSSETYGVRVAGCAIADDYDHDLGDPVEAMLAAALQYRDMGSCPSPSVVAGITTSSVKTAEKPAELTPGLNVMRHNRDMRMPE
ncbi:S41 family peptidase [Hyphococcus luteus]|uniref:Peptidase n=1 Tax=Hyphococcus luteus TaxID=2058213 RepID=A0A2S7KA23_9PROT|nr:S41 family peptidase [Marinicaulis flavus]PQA89328.1 peptidase [Marinicaulis flavus]